MKMESTVSSWYIENFHPFALPTLECCSDLRFAPPVSIPVLLCTSVSGQIGNRFGCLNFQLHTRNRGECSDSCLFFTPCIDFPNPHVSSHDHMYACIGVRVFVCMCVCARVRVCVHAIIMGNYMRVCIHVLCVRVCMYMHACVHVLYAHYNVCAWYGVNVQQGVCDGAL